MIDHDGAPGALLRAAGVTVIRSGSVILDDVSLTVERGQRWALMGANGAGKSTLISLLAAIEHPSRGVVEVLGHRLGRVDVRDLRPHVGLVASRFAPARDLDALEVTLTGATGSADLVPRWRPADALLSRARTLLAAFGVDPARAQRWSTMSQGERARTLIARALLTDPAVLLLDEAATGLDVAGREQLIEALDDAQAARPQLGMVTVTHHFEELPRSTTHALLLRDGRTVAAGPVQDVLDSAQVSECFAHPLVVTRVDGRWHARTDASVTRPRAPATAGPPARDR